MDTGTRKFSRLEQSQKARSSMISSFDFGAISTAFNFLQFSNAPMPMISRLAGIEINSTSSFPLNTFSPMRLMPSSIFIALILSHLLKRVLSASSSIVVLSGSAASRGKKIKTLPSLFDSME